MKLQIRFLGILIIIPILALSQPTWIRTQNLDNQLPAPNHDSTNVGPDAICLTPNKTIIALVQTNQNGAEAIFAYDAQGHNIWTHHGSVVGGIYSEDCSGLLPTPDNGCVYVFNHYSSGNYNSIFRLSPGGSVLWSKTFNQFSPYIYAEYIVPSTYNTFFVKFNNDSLVELNDNGSFIRNRFPFNGTIYSLPDSDIIVFNSSVLSRETFSGLQSWSVNLSGNSIVSVDSSFILTRTSGNVTKIRTTDGTIVWSKPASSTMIAAKSDGGFVALSSPINQITNYDSSGTYQWTKILNFPHFNLRSISEGPNQTIITGGCWRNKYLYYPFYYGYSPFLASIDQSGNGVIDSTDYFFTGNANDNYTLSFNDDAIYVSAAINSIGPERDYFSQISSIGMNVYCEDWLDSFPSGLNYKYSDCDGNGIIDTTDIRMLADISPANNYTIFPHWLRVASSIALPELQLNFDNSSANYYDTITIYAIAGTNNFPIDSIYGISFEYGLNGNNLLVPISFKNLLISPTTLGVTSNNLFSYYKANATNFTNSSYLILCRKNQQNVSLTGDTLFSIKYLLNTTVSLPDTLFTRGVINAISASGISVPLNLIVDTLLLTGFTKIDESKSFEINIFPIPSNDWINFSYQKSLIQEMIITDETGRIIDEIKNPGENFILNVRNYAEGFYFVSASSFNKISRSKFLVVH